MSSAKQIGVILVLAALAVGAWAGYSAFFGPAGEGARGGGQRRSSPAPSVTTATLAPRQIETRLEAVGTTRALQAVEIVPLTNGRVVEIAFEPGQKVIEGAVLVRLDDEIERANLTEAEATLAQATFAEERALTLSQTNTISRAQVEQLTAASATAQAAVDRARRRLADRTVRAPFDGMVGLGDVEIGARVDDDTTITTLDDLSQVEIEFSLPETVFGQIIPGLAITADSAAFPGRVFEGEIASIDSRIDQNSRSFKVRALVPNSQTLLPAGMFMHLTVMLDQRSALMVAEQALVAEAGQNFLFVIEDGKALRRDVKIGRREVGAVEITQGLAEGEVIVVKGVQKLRDGAKVRIAGPEGAGEHRSDGKARGGLRPADG